MGFGELWRCLFLGAANGCILRCDVLKGIALLAAFLRSMAMRHLGQLLLDRGRRGQSSNSLGQVLGMGRCIWVCFGRDEHAFGSADNAPCVGRKLPALTTRLLAPTGVFNARDMPQRQLAALMIAFQLRLDLAGCVIKHQMVAAIAFAQLAAA